MGHDYWTDFKRANNYHTMLVGGTFFAAFIIGAVSFGTKDKAPTEVGEAVHRTVHQFSLHAYQNGAPGRITLAGPFLGKIRVIKDPNAKTLVNDSTLTAYKFQADCNNISDVEVRGKCQIMRTPPMYLGKIHSAWSVLGAQSITSIVKHIFWIVLAFALFTMSELWMRHGFCKDSQRSLRLGVVGLAIILFVVDFVWDFAVPNMHALDASTQSVNAIGSVTTGASLWLVCLLIICFSHVDDAVVVTGDDSLASKDSDEAKKKYTMYNAETDRYKRFEAQLHLTVNTSFVILLLMPLFALLSLTAFGKPVVDVHVQMVFFSYIFFAVLDVLQSRVVSVLASLTLDNSLAPGIGFIKAFVVVAFVLCKFFVFFPTWQLMGLYYAPWKMSVPCSLHIFEIILVAGLSVFDLAYISGLVGKISGAKTITADIEAHASCRSAVLCVYLFGSFITMACVTPV